MMRLRAVGASALAVVFIAGMGACARNDDGAGPTTSAPTTSPSSTTLPSSTTRSVAPPASADACALPAFPTLVDVPEGAELKGQAVVGIASILVRLRSASEAPTSDTGSWITVDVQRGPSHLPGPDDGSAVEVRTADQVVEATHRTEARSDDDGAHHIGFLTWVTEPGLGITVTSYDVDLPRVLEVLTSLRLVPLEAYEAFLAAHDADPVCT